MIPVNTPDLSGNEKKYLAECIETGWISSEGPFIPRLEEAMCRLTGRRYGIAVCNGSAALDVAFQALQLQPGDEVILPTFTIISCIQGILRVGARPVVVDADPVTWNMDVAQVESKITRKTKAILAVHIYGLPVNMEPLLALARRHHLQVVEDAAEAIGLTCRVGQKDWACGSFGLLSTFSFYPNKTITTGEGGMILTDDEQLAERCRSIRNLCFGRGDLRFHHEELGYNYRMCNLQAAVGCAQYERLAAAIRRKREIGTIYQKAFADLTSVELPCPATPYAQNLYWVFGLVLKEQVPFDAAEAMRRLTERGIGTRPFFWPMHEQPVLRRMGLFAGERYPVAERLARRGFYIPSGLGITNPELAEVCGAVRDMLQTGSIDEVRK